MGYRVVAFDLPGHGRNVSRTNALNTEDVASTIADELRGMRADLLVGHSFGAAVALTLAVVRPDIVGRLVLEDPPGRDRSRDDNYQAELLCWAKAARTDPIRQARQLLANNPNWLAGDAARRVIGLARCDIDAIIASVRADTQRQSAGIVGRVVHPALYLLADETHSALGHQRAELRSALRGRATVIEFDSGHAIHRDQLGGYLAAIRSWADCDSP